MDKHHPRDYDNIFLNVCQTIYLTIVNAIFAYFSKHKCNNKSLVFGLIQTPVKRTLTPDPIGI